MEHSYRRVYAEIDLDRLCGNLGAMRDRLPAGTAMAAVVKTDAYGHGAVPVARAADPFVRFFCTATADEALNLRENGIEKPILVLGPHLGEDYREMIAADIRPTVFTEAQAERVSRSAEAVGKPARIHLALDTGMHRIGMAPTEASAELCRRIAAMPGIAVEGLFTHLYRADERDLSRAEEQVRCFSGFLGLLRERGVNPEICHVANSAGIMTGLGTGFQMCRAGITMYGIYPSDEVDRSLLRIRPVMSLRSEITYVKDIPAGAEVSYGGTFRAERPMRIATVPVGYGDGYPRSLSSKGEILILGRRAPILGRVCMDQMMVDVSHIPEAAEGVRVTLLGEDGGAEITVDELGEKSGRFPYEFVCDVGKRVPRVYLSGGRVTAVSDHFHDRF